MYATIDDKVLEFRRHNDYEGAEAYLCSLMPCIGERLGVVKAHRALNLYRISPNKAIDALRLLDEAELLLEGVPTRRVRALIDALIISLFLLQRVRAQRYVDELLAYARSKALDIVPWLGRIYYNVAVYHMHTNNLAEAEHWLRKSYSFYLDHIGPFNAKDQRCQKGLVRQAMCIVYVKNGQMELAREAFADVVLFMGDDIRQDALTALRGYMALACGCYDQAIAHYEEAYKLIHASRDHLLMHSVIEGLIKAHEANGTVDSFVDSLPPLRSELAMEGYGRPLLLLDRFAALLR